MYEYRCTACGYSFEKIQSFSAQPETVCPKCQGALIRPVTAPALRFEGAGWYVNDYAGKGGAKAPETAAGDGVKPAEGAEKPGDSGAGTSGAKSGSTNSSAAAPVAPVASASSTPASTSTTQ